MLRSSELFKFCYHWFADGRLRHDKAHGLSEVMQWLSRMREQQLGAAASPLAGRQVQLRHTIALGGCSASPLPQFATARFIVIPQSSVFSAGLRHMCLGDALYTRSLKARWVKASAFRRARGSCYSSGSLRTSGLQCNPTNTPAWLQGWQITVGAWRDHLQPALPPPRKCCVSSPGHVCFHGPGICFWGATESTYNS